MDRAINTPKSAPAVCEALEHWYSRESGQYLLSKQRDRVAQLLETAFGYHILQLGVTRDHTLIDGSRINHHVYAAACPGGRVSLLCTGDEIPLESDSVDVLVAHHAVEFSDNPHQSLREMHRVLAPQGRLILLGFNPYSPGNMAHAIQARLGYGPWPARRTVGAPRMIDWLHLIGCELQSADYLYTLPAPRTGRLHEWLRNSDQWLGQRNWPLGGVYVLHAIKQVCGRVEPRRLAQGRSRRLIGLVSDPAPQPTPAVPGLRNRNKND